jgi:hypothetical protein
MDLVFRWWLKRKAREHRSTAILFFAFAAAVTALLFAIVIQRSVRTPATYYFGAGEPDFQKLVPAASGEVDRSFWRVTAPGEPSFLVGFRGERGAEVALIRWDRSLANYRVVSIVPLSYGAEHSLPKFTPVILGDDEIFLARLAQDNGWQSIYLLSVSFEGLSVVSRRPSGAAASAEPFIVGSGSGSCRSLRIGDVDGDGAAVEVLASVETADRVEYEAYRWQAGRLVPAKDLENVAEQADSLFANPADRCQGDQGIYYDERSGDGSLWTNFLPAESETTPKLEPLFEEME